VSGDTGWLSQVVLREPDPDHPDYPPVTEGEAAVLDVIAAGLYLSKSSVYWAYWNAARRGQKDSFRKILAILEHKPVKMTVG
jgi:hypothetical protein